MPLPTKKPCRNFYYNDAMFTISDDGCNYLQQITTQLNIRLNDANNCTNGSLAYAELCTLLILGEGIWAYLFCNNLTILGFVSDRLPCKINICCCKVTEKIVNILDEWIIHSIPIWLTRDKNTDIKVRVFDILTIKHLFITSCLAINIIFTQ